MNIKFRKIYAVGSYCKQKKVINKITYINSNINFVKFKFINILRFFLLN